MVDRRGPVRSNRFSVDLEIDGTQISGWQRVDLPAGEVREVSYREGDDTNADRSLTGAQTEYGDIILERGVEPEGEMPITGDSLAGTALYDWWEKIRLGMVDANRKDIKVTILNEQGEAIVGYMFHHAWPKRYEPPTLDAGASNVATETLVLTYHWMERADP